MKKIRLIVLLLFICALVLPFHSTVNAQDESESDSAENGKTCIPLDVIFIIDQSGSMSGSMGETPTDPYQQRKNAVDAMIDWFGDNIVDVCSDISHQVGVISFGTEARIDIPMTEINPDNFEDSLRIAEKLKAKTKADDMYFTNPISGFKLAKQMFAESKITGKGPRKQVIIFLTDGLINYDPSIRKNAGIGADSAELATYVNDNFPFDSVLLAREQCLSSLEADYGDDGIPPEKTAECLANEPKDVAYQNSTYIYMVLMNFGTAWPTQIKDTYKNVTDSHAGVLMDFYDRGEKNNNAIPTNFRIILEKLIGIPSSVRDCGPVAVNPYLQRAIFTFYKYSPDFNVKIRYTDQETGKQYEVENGVSNGGFDIPADGGYTSYGNGANEKYVINHPKPGIYYIESDKCVSNGIIPAYEEAKINTGGYTLPFKNIPQYDLEPYYDTSDPFYLTYEMRDSAGDVYKNEPDPFGVNVQVSVTYPNGGKTINYAMQWNEAENQFKSVEPLQVQFIGTYKVNITGTKKVHNQEIKTVPETLSEAFNAEEVLFSHKDLEFTVDEVKPFEIVLDKPEDGKVLGQIHGSILDGWPLPIKPIQVKARVTLRNNVDLDQPISSILNNPDQSLQGWVEFQDGSISDKVYLNLDKNSTNTFSGEIPNIDSEAPLKMYVELSGGFNEDYRPDFRVVKAEFSRKDILPIYKPGFYFAMIWIVIIGLLALTVYEIVNHYDPVDGQLVIYQNNVVAGTLFLWSGKRVTRFSKKKLDGYDISKLSVSYKKYDRYENDDVSADNQVRDVVVKGKTECKSAIDFLLASNDSYSYCAEHTEFEMKYENPNPPSRAPYLRLGLYFLLPVIAVLLIIVFFLM